MLLQPRVEHVTLGDAEVCAEGGAFVLGCSRPPSCSIGTTSSTKVSIPSSYISVDTQKPSPAPASKLGHSEDHIELAHERPSM